ncbi:MAG: HDIG domain-containing protein [Clostridiales bacterium]|nr:HDIG domain-containing protein [Clostridiales bacterium]
MHKGLKRTLAVFISLLMIATIVVCVFFGYIPVKYDYEVGSIATSDIYASRNVIDSYQTKYDAVLAKNSVKNIFVRSGSESDDNIKNIKSFYQLVRQSRALLLDEYGTPVDDVTPIRDNLINNVYNTLDYQMSEEDAMSYLTMSYYSFNYLEDKARSVTEILMMDLADKDSLDIQINSQLKAIFEEDDSFSSYKDLLNRTMSGIIRPNAIYDVDATNEAAENAYNMVMEDPVEIQKGTKIVSSGDVITEHSYQILSDLELLSDDSFDLLLLFRVLLYVAVVSVVLFFFFKLRKDKLNIDFRIMLSLIILFVIPVLVSVYVSTISHQAVVILFFTTLCAAFIGVSDSIILSVFLLVYMWPIYSFDSDMFMASLAGIVICASLSGRNKANSNTAGLIIFPTLSVSIVAFILNFLNGSIRNDYIDTLGISSLSAAISIVAAIGLMPIFELISGSVSPVKLIDLSQPSQPLLKRLFIEAPGTSQHSMMVANLSDAAADAIGADALLCRVSSYFHDIGKLNNPGYFTENQKDYNPHSVLTPAESTAIITAHIDDGVKMAQKDKLPKAIIDIIKQHHGTTYPSFFYKKALEEAKLKGLPEPDVNSFRYRGEVPQTREAAIVMLADTCEAAIKSAKTTDLVQCESIMRKLIKYKIEEDQLVSSGLSFNDIEKIISAFLNIYSGQFHERIKYPE